MGLQKLSPISKRRSQPAGVRPLTNTAIQIGEKIGPVPVNMGNTACQVPFAPDYIRKVQKLGAITKKRKTAKC